MINDSRDKPKKDAGEEEATGLRRWSQRKTLARIEQRNANDVLAPEAEHKALPATEQSEPSEMEKNAQKQELTDEDMLPIEALDEKSDLSPFFSPKVSADLRRLALRKIFHLPVYNIRDGLNDYDEDYTVFEPLGDVITADMRHMQEVAEKRRQEQLAEAETRRQAEQASVENQANQASEVDQANNESANDEAPCPPQLEAENNQDQQDDEEKPA